MKKIFEGTIVSNKMQNTVIVEVVRQTAHKLYRKLLIRSKRMKADTNGKEVKVGDTVKIQETKPISKGKNFIILEVKQS